MTSSTPLSTTSTTSSISRSSVYTPEAIVSVDTTSESISHYTQPIKYLRSRNISFDCYRLKPVTKFYAFFQGIDVNKYVVPKLLEITMVSGKFVAGETVVSDPNFTAAKISFRLCTPNHKTGPYNAPIQLYKLIPFNQQPPPSDYSETSTYLNVDTRSLDLPTEADFYGYVAPNMTLIGKTSGAVARVSPVRLVSDNFGRVLGSFFIPDPNVPENPMWINGENVFTLSDVPSLNILPSLVDAGGIFINQSSANLVFTSVGVLNTKQTNILTTRNVTVYSGYNTNTTTITNNTTNTTTTNPLPTTPSAPAPQPPTDLARIERRRDPLAQSFFVSEDTGVFLTSVEVYFETKSENVPVTLQLRPMIAGVPSSSVIPFSEVTLEPDQVNLSTNGSVATRFTFSSPVYLAGPQQQNLSQRPNDVNTQGEYAIVLLSDSVDYRVFISRLSETDLQSGSRITRQPTLGSLFKSQNGDTWTPSQFDDLKYKIYRADFVNEGLVRYFNPELGLGNGKLTVTQSNEFTPLSKRILVGLGSTGYNSNVVPGVTISQGSASGTLIGIAGSITVGTGVTVSEPGVGYTNGTFNNVSLITETGYGKGATANVVVAANVVDSVTIVNGGLGYQVGDSLLVPDLGSNVGFGAKVVVNTIASNNAFVIDNVQGTFTSGISSVNYINSSGTTVTVGTGVTISSITEDLFYDGLHMKVNHINHGMHSPTNYVKISEAFPTNDEVNTTLSAALSASETTTINLANVTGFDTFEGLAVSPSNPGYIVIGEEVISYTTISGSTLTNIARGVDGTQAQSYATGISVFKYQLNGISLRRINKIHNFAEVDVDNHPITLDSYYIKIDTSDTDFNNQTIGVDRSNQLYFNKTIQTGQAGAVLTNNIQYEVIEPLMRYINLSKTNIEAQLRTFSGTSIGGNEISFADNGFQSISLDEPTYLNAPSLVCSDVNEQAFINESPGNRSLTMSLLLQTTDSRVSPVIDNTGVAVRLSSNLFNNPIGIDDPTAYALDNDVRSLYGDKHNSIYISKPVRLKIPANSLKVVLSASKNNTNDIRVLYRLFRDDSTSELQNYELFPGYSNYQVDGTGIKRVIDPSLNDGTADSFVQESSNREFKDYEYSVDDLPNFSGFAIKIVMAGKNQAIPPIIKDLRAIATIKPKL